MSGCEMLRFYAIYKFRFMLDKSVIIWICDRGPQHQSQGSFFKIYKI